MILLDTSVLSALMRLTPEPEVVIWLDHQPRTSVWTTSITLWEIRFGLHVLAPGRKRSALADAFEGLMDAIGHRVAPFDSSAAVQSGDLMAARQKKGRPGDLRDTMIAGIVLANHATLATRNTVHFDDLSIPLVNPWKA